MKKRFITSEPGFEKVKIKTILNGQKGTFADV